MVYVCSPRYRRDFKRNLALAGLGDFRRAAVAEAGKSVTEVPAVWLRPFARVAELVVEVKGWEHVAEGARRGKGIIVVTPHIGCWEIVGQYIASRMPITVMYSPPKMKLFEPLMRIGRSRDGAMKAFPPICGGVRATLKALRRGEAIGVLPDQVPGIGEGEWVEFFGKPAYTMTLVGRISEQTGAPVLLCCAERLPRGAAIASLRNRCSRRGRPSRRCARSTDRWSSLFAAIPSSTCGVTTATRCRRVSCRRVPGKEGSPPC